VRSEKVDVPDDVTSDQIDAFLEGVAPLQAAADAALEALASARREQVALTARRQALAEALAAARGAAASGAAAAQAALMARDGARARVDGVRAALAEATARLLGGVDTEAPLLLLPVRLETRFETAPGAGRPSALRIRVYPDDLHVDSHEPELTEEEESWGNHFQRALASASGEPERRAAWRQLAGRFGPRRATWIAAALAPGAPAPGKRASTWTRAPLARLLPDRWLALAYSGASPVAVAFGKPIPPSLAAGPSPQPGAAPPAPDGLPATDAGMRWMVDFEAAVDAGMALRLPVDERTAKSGIDRLLVVGVRGAASTAQGATELVAALAAHRFGRGLAVLPLDTPTNDTAEHRAGGADPDVEAAYALALGPPALAGPVPPPADRLDGHWLAWALGLPADTFARVEHAAGAEVRGARAALAAVASQCDSTLLRLAGAGKTPAAAPADACASGPLPSIRVGPQVYGLLPAMAHRHASAQAPADDAGRARIALLDDEARCRAAAAGAFAAGARTDEILAQAGAGTGYLLESFRPGADDTSTPLGLAEALARLPALPPGIAAGRARDAIDAATHRPDVWLTALATQRLTALRQAQPTGLRVGGWGYVEDLRQTKALVPVPPVPGLPGPVATSPENRGYLQAPSLGHAAAAAVLRSGFVAQGGPAESAIDLSSARARRARWLLDGVRQGQPLAALLGYRFERGLQESGLGAYLAPFRTLAALKREDAIGQALEAVRLREADLASAQELEATWGGAVAAEKAKAEKEQQARASVDALEGAAARVGPAQTAVDDAQGRLDAARSALATHAGRRPRSTAKRPPDGGLEADTLDDPDEFSPWFAENEALAGEVGRRRRVLREADERLAAARSAADAAGKDLPRARDALERAAAELGGATKAVAAAQKAAAAKPVDGPGGAQAALADARAALAAAVTASWGEALESIAAAQVADGLELHRRWRAAHPPGGGASDWSARTIPFGHADLGFPAADAPEGRGIQAQLGRLADDVDAVGDLLVAESVYQLARGNPQRAGAALDVLSPRGGAPPAELEVLQTPRSGAAVTHRLFTLLPADGPAPAAWPVGGDSVRSLAEPALEACAAALLPPAAQIACPVEYRADGSGELLGTATVKASELGLSALEFAAAAAGGVAAGAPADELGERVAEVARRRAAAPPGARVLLLPEDVAGLAPDEVPLAAAAELASSLHHLFASSRPADARDLDAGEVAADLAELELRVAAIRSSTAALKAELVSALAAALSAGAPEAAGELRRQLWRASHWRLGARLPAREEPSAEATLAAWSAQASAAVKELEARLARADRAGERSSGAETPLERLRALLGGDALILPRVDRSAAAPWLASLEASDELQGGDPLAASAFVQRAAWVREGAGRLQRLLSYARALDRPDALLVGQLPWQAGDRWVALAPRPGEALLRGRVSTVVQRPLALGVGGSPVKALLIDSWTEVVPSEEETTAVAFHYDQPGAVAPQVALVAVAPPGAARWELDLLQATAVQAIELARARAAPADGRTELVWFDEELPRRAAVVADGGVWPWSHGSPRPLSRSRAHRSRAAAGLHQHFFEGAADGMLVGTGETLFACVYLHRPQLPRELMLQWRVDGSWEHRAFWGEDLIAWGEAGKPSRRSMGPLPAAGQWIRLEVPAAWVDLEGKEVDGMAFTLFDGSATWDRAGRLTRPAAARPWGTLRADRVWMRDRPPPRAALAPDGEGWRWVSHDPAPLQPGDGDPARARFSHRSPPAAGLHQHYFTAAREPWWVAPGDRLFAWVHLDDAGPAPRQILLQWNVAGSWEHRAFWGEDLVPWGELGKPSRFRVSPALPERRGWVRLEVDAEAVDLAGRVVSGMAFGLFDGGASWGPVGLSTPAQAGELILP